MPRRKKIDEEFRELPACVIDYIGRIARMVGYRRKVRREVRRELQGHFADALSDCPSPEEKQAQAERLIAEFGDPHLLAILCRRAKKRCRPLWLKVIGGTRMAVFLLVALAGSYTAWFVSGKPVITNEYVVRMNQLGSRQLAASDNAWPQYERAVSLFAEPDEALKAIPAFKVRSLTNVDDSQRQMIVAWIEANESAWAHYEMGSHKAGYHRPFRYDRRLKAAPLLMEMAPLSPLAPLRRLAEIGLWKARIAAEEGHLDESIDDCLVLARVGAHLQTSVDLVEQLLGIALGAGARVELLRIMAEYDLPETTLTRIQRALTELYPNGVPFANFEGARLGVLDAVQHIFTESGLGGGHMIPGQFTGLVSAVSELPPDWRGTMLKRTFLWPMDIGLSMIHARRNRTVATINKVYDEIDERAHLSPHQRVVSGTKEVGESISLYRYGFIRCLLPAERRVSELAFRFRADHEATLLVLALQRHRMKMGAYPDDLKSLVDARDLGHVPTDPYSDSPLVYKHLGDELLLYSVGPDFVDDGGKPGVDDKGQPKAWADNGDRVFWPVEGSPE